MSDDNKFSEHSLAELKGVHVELVICATEALLYCQRNDDDFIVFDGIRTEAEQRKNIARGVSWTMDSYHLPQADGYGYAIDLVPYVQGRPRWDSADVAIQELIDRCWSSIEEGMKSAIARHGFAIDWGFDLWRKDKPHWQKRRG